MLKHVGDNIGVVAGLEAETATIVGHDWGAPIAATSALLRPDVFTALGLLSVPYSPRSSTRPSDALRVMGGEEEFYIEYFQEPGRAESEAEADLQTWLLGFYFSASGDSSGVGTGEGTMATIPHGAKMSDRFEQPDVLPAWFTQEDLDFYVNEFERTGLTGGFNRYRNIDRDWEDLAAFHHAPITVPAMFIGGDKDGPTIWGAGAIARFDTNLPNLHSSTILEGCGHWTNRSGPKRSTRR